MATIAGITFGDVKDDLSKVVANGVCGDDERVIKRCNEATKALLDAGYWVGTMATYDVVAEGTQLLLPKELENAIEVEVQAGAPVRNQTDVTEGWNDSGLVNAATFVDPAFQHDNPLVDMFLERDSTDHSILRRRYDYPGLNTGATVRVTGAKRYYAIKDDGDTLIIQNIPALKDAILSREYRERGAGAIDDAMKYWQFAIEALTNEVRKHQLDPRRALKRKAAYQSDIATFAEGTLGRTRARLALELPGFINRGKSEINYLVNRAVQMLVDSRNQLAIAGRLSVHGTTDEIAYVPATEADTLLPWSDYNQIRLMVQSFVTEGPDPNAVTVAEEYQKKALELQRAQLIEATELARHHAYTVALETYVSGTFGWTVARLALELKDGLSLTMTELERLCSMAEMRIMERGVYKGCIKSLSATIMGGEILFPRDVEAVLAADVCGNPLDIRSIFFPFQRNGPGACSSLCEGRFDDAGEVYFPDTGAKRRKYIYRACCEREVQLKALCKFRWVQKVACDEMVIKNFEAIRLFSQGILNEKAEKWNEAIGVQGQAVEALDKELEQYLGGIEHTQNVDTNAGFGYEGLGCAL